MLVAEKEKQPFLDDRSAQPRARIAAREKRIRIERAALESWIGRHVVVPEIKISAAMEIVAARSGYDVDAASRGDPCRRVKVHRRNLELLHHFLREVHRRAAFNFVVDNA